MKDVCDVILQGEDNSLNKGNWRTHYQFNEAYIRRYDTGFVVIMPRLTPDAHINLFEKQMAKYLKFKRIDKAFGTYRSMGVTNKEGTVDIYTYSID